MTYRSHLLGNGSKLDYIDTNVIISFLNRRDVNHVRAVKIFDHTDKRVTLPIAVLELKSVLLRTTNIVIDEIEAFADYLPEIGVEVPETDMDKIFSKAIEIAVNVRMKTFDILHISASLILESDTIVTFDREFVEKKKELANIGLRIYSGR